MIEIEKVKEKELRDGELAVLKLRVYKVNCGRIVRIDITRDNVSSQELD